MKEFDLFNNQDQPTNQSNDLQLEQLNNMEKEQEIQNNQEFQQDITAVDDQVENLANQQIEDSQEPQVTNQFEDSQENSLDDNISQVEQSDQQLEQNQTNVEPDLPGTNMDNEVGDNQLDQESAGQTENESLKEQESEVAEELSADKITEPQTINEQKQNPLNHYPAELVFFNNNLRGGLIVSLIGLLLSIFVFPGIIVSIIGVCINAINLKKNKTKTVLWGLWLGILGVIVNLVVIISVILLVL